MTFAKLGLVPKIQSVIDSIGFKEPTPIQQESIPHIISGRDLIGSAQTGTGKTAAFALPILHLIEAGKQKEGVRCLAIGPTRELVAQIKEQFTLFGQQCDTNICLLHGGVGYKHQIDCLNSGAEIVVATPGRLIDHVKNKTIDLSSVDYLILDEVDRMLDMGFVDDVLKIISFCPKPQQADTFIFGDSFRFD